MKIIKLHSSKNDDGYFPIPENMVNHKLFNYPNQNGDKKIINKKYRKINAIVCYYGEKYYKENKKWSISMMGFNSMILSTEDGEMFDVFFDQFMYNGSQLLCKLEDGDSGVTYKNMKVVLQRLEKIEKILDK